MSAKPDKAAKPDTGFIAPGLHRFWMAGVLVSAVLVAIVASLTFGRGNLVLAWAAPLAFAAVFLCMFDTRGVFRAGRMIAAIAAVVVVSRLLLHVQRPNKFILVGIITALLVVYAFGGGLGLVFGARRQRSENSPNR